MDILGRGKCGQECLLICGKAQGDCILEKKMRKSNRRVRERKGVDAEEMSTLGQCWRSRQKLLGTWDSPGQLFLAFTSSVQICMCL